MRIPIAIFDCKSFHSIFFFVYRGENLLSCWAMREVDGKGDTCIFEWLLCLDLKGYFPRRLLDAVT